MSGFGLHGDVVLLTGASGGIGQAAAAALRAAGATVIGTDLQASGHVLRQDVTSAQDWAQIAEHIGKQHGRLSCLVNNAAFALTASMETTTLEAWRRVQSVNVESVLLGMQAMLALLRAGAAGRGGGASVVNMSSVGGLRGAAFSAAYCASKAAVVMLSKSAALEFAALGYDIRVNTIHPGGVETAMMMDIMARHASLGMVGSEASARAAVETRHPMGRLGRPEEIAGAIVYLCSQAASFVTGSELVVDGGFTAM